MNPILRNVLAVLAGIALGMIANMGVIMMSMSVVPAPEGVDVMDPESIKANLHLFEAKHFVFPFLAHAVGTFVGSLLTALLAATRKVTLAYVVAAFFFLGGISAAFMIPAPTWFVVLDLVGAYFPLAWLGGWLATDKKEE